LTCRKFQVNLHLAARYFRRHLYIVSEKQTVLYKKKVTMHGSCNCQWVNRFLTG